MKQQHFSYILYACLATCFLQSCNDTQDGMAERYMLPETRAVNLTTTQKEMIQANNDFAFDLFCKVHEKAGNKSFSFSPMGVTFMLGLIGNGASDGACQEIAQTMGFGRTGTDGINQLCHTLIEEMPKTDKQVTLEVANAIYTNKGKTLRKDFVQKAQTHYQAQAATMDFSHTKTLEAINNWTKQKTHGMIPKILDNINPDAQLYLLNSCYFQATWTKQFDKEYTQPDNFTTESGQQIKVPMMHNKALICYSANEICRMICLPYGSGTAWNMYIVVPEKDKTIKDVLDLMDDTSWQTLFQAEQPMNLELFLPKFTTESRADLKTILPELGIKRIFDSTGELNRLCENTALQVEKMYQQNRIEVNEEGSKATAITVSEVGDTSTPEPTYTPFRADRPFIYFIRENSTNAICFMGAFQGN